MVEDNIKELMVDIILRAFEDYRAFQECGLIVRGRVCVRLAGEVRVKGARAGDVFSVVWFFWQGGAEIAAELGGFKLDLGRVRQKLEPEAWHELQAEGQAR
jgi:hypothetical protein